MGAVIFDLDGVLVESEPYWQTAFAEVGNGYVQEIGGSDPALTAEHMGDYLGGRVDESLRTILERLGYVDAAEDADVITRLTERVIDRASALFEQDPAPIAESVRAAEELHGRGITLAVASSSAPAFIDLALHVTGLDYLFEVRQSALGLEKGKPDPEVYRLVLERLGGDPSGCMAIEDSPKGVGAAVAAGIRCIGLWRHAEPVPAEFQRCVSVTDRLAAEEIEAVLLATPS